MKSLQRNTFLISAHQNWKVSKINFAGTTINYRETKPHLTPWLLFEVWQRWIRISRRFFDIACRQAAIFVLCSAYLTLRGWRAPPNLLSRSQGPAHLYTWTLPIIHRTTLDLKRPTYIAVVILLST